MPIHRLVSVLLPLATVVSIVAACSSDDATSPSAASDAGNDAQVDSATPTEDSGASHEDAATDATSPAAACAAASAALAATADAQAPVLDAAKSNLQRVASNDAACVARKNDDKPTFGSYGYLLNVFLHDADGDGPVLADLTSVPGPVRFGSSPIFDVTDKFDRAHGFTTQGESFILQLCLDQVYAPGSLTIAVDVADDAGHRSKAICITEGTGG